MENENLETEKAIVEKYLSLYFSSHHDWEHSEKYDGAEWHTDKAVLQDIVSAMREYRKQQADKILQRLSVIFTDYKNAGFENSAQVTKYIMNEIETLVKN